MWIARAESSKKVKKSRFFVIFFDFLA